MTARTRTRLHPDERRRLILAAAHRAFTASEYSAVSLDEIAGSAGVTRGLLHHYFGSKRALYLAVIERTAALAASVPLVPADLEGPLPTIVDACVTRWLETAEAAGGLWITATSPFALAHTDVEEVLAAARDVLVERMIDELPLPGQLDRSMVRGAFRSFSAFARVATDDWLLHGTLSRAQAHALLSGTLLALVDEVVPAMERAAPVDRSAPADPSAPGS